MNESIRELLDRLPKDNLTVKMLNALNFVTPDKWENVIGFNQTITAVTGETDANAILAIGNKALELYNDPKNGYQGAIWYYQTVDKVDDALGKAAMVNKIGEKIGFLGFLKNLTPKADTTQSFDLCLKLVAELIAYSKLNGLPILKPGQFLSELKENYTGPSLIRMAALVCVDGLLPLGPDFLQKIHSTLEQKGDRLESAALYGAIGNAIPADDKVGFITNTFETMSGWMGNLVTSVGLTPQKVYKNIGGFIEFSDDSLDFVAAFLDQSTDYYKHTGTQTVARKLIAQAAQEI